MAKGPPGITSIPFAAEACRKLVVPPDIVCHQFRRRRNEAFVLALECTKLASKKSLGRMVDSKQFFGRYLTNIADIAPLDQVGWLAGQPKGFQDWAAEAGRWRRYGAGQFVYHAGDIADGLYGLASGSLEITFPLAAEEPVSIYRAEIGFWIGDAAELAEIPRMVSLVAATESQLFHLPSRAIQQLLSIHPEHWRAFYRLSALNSRTAIMLLSEALSLTVRARVSRRLLQLAERSQEAPITQDDMAKLVGVTRGTLRRCLDDLAARGGIEMHYRKLRVLDPNVLIAFQDEQ